MKRYNQIYIFKKAVILSFFSFLLWTSCEKSEDTSPPIIDKIRLTEKDSAVTSAGIGSTIAILGSHLASTQQVFFNGYSVLLNPSYIKDDVVLATIPREVPYRGQINKIKLVTLYGEVIQDFNVRQPEPEIKSFAPTSGNPGDIVTVFGEDLDNLKTVMIGADTVEVLPGGTDKQFKIKVPPAGAAGLIYVLTIGGEIKSLTSFGVSLVIFGDKMDGSWDAYEWDADRNMESTEQVKKGKSIKMTFLKPYGGFGAGTGDVINIKKYSALKMSIYALTTAAEAKVKVGIKGADGTTNSFSKILILKPGWNDFTLDFAADLNKPDRFVEFQIQEWGNPVIPVIFIDDIGLL
jgi:hypothetical protein